MTENMPIINLFNKKEIEVWRVRDSPKVTDQEFDTDLILESEFLTIILSFC